MLRSRCAGQSACAAGISGSTERTCATRRTRKAARSSSCATSVGEWLRARLRASAARRAGVEREAEAFRLVYSEGDLLPSIIVDRYADVLVLQTLSQGAESLKATLVELLVEEFAPRAVVERNDVRVRALEGLPSRSGVLYGEEP